MMKKYLLSMGLLIGVVAVNAQDRLFTYTYQSNVNSKGQKELEVWSTMHNGRDNFYRAFDHTLEFEIGLGSKLQTSFYLNYGYSKGIETNAGVDNLFSNNDYSFSNEWKLKLSDPVANTIGSAVYFEYKLGTSETELEAKIILDKQIGKTLQCINIVGENEFEKNFETSGSKIKAENESEWKFEFNYGFSYQLNKNLAFGIEARNQNIVDDKVWEFSVLSAGPCISYNHEGFWMNLTILPQISNLKSSKRELTENEKLQTRLIFAYVL